MFVKQTIFVPFFCWAFSTKIIQTKLIENIHKIVHSIAV